MPELRRDPVIGRWVIISTERGKRPSDFLREEDTIASGPCPFCPGFEDKTPPELLAYHPPQREKNKSGWWTRVVPNKFPALQIEGNLNRTGDGMYDKMNGLGAHEVVIESPDHSTDIPDMDPRRIEDVFWAFRDRIVDLKKDPRFEYIMIFKNKGYAAGASLQHPHSQLIATPMIPISVKQEIVGGENYFDYKERCVFCDIVKQELTQNVRVIMQNEDFVAIAPFASRFPFEIWVLPKRHDSDFEDIQKNEMNSLAQIMKGVLGKMNKVLDLPPYNFLIHNAPLKENRLPHYHWHIEIIPKLTRVAGFEWGTGFYINPTPPEDAARYLRDAD